MGRIDIAYKVSSLSNFLARPKNGHIYQALHIFKYFEAHIDNKISFDPLYQEIRNDTNPQSLIRKIREIYADASEDLPTNAQALQGKSIHLNCFVDANHGGNRVTRWSQIGIILFKISAPLLWYSKRQNTVESSTFGLEFVALRIAPELITSFRYKLRMFGIP